ncbi:MAG: hypothetical protein INR71_13165 [Terriglobus roseus]|nr:hypothetical protein [Terriglobus roseus]
MPVFLATQMMGVPLVVPATARLMLLLASDLILILTRSFRETTLTGVGQPLPAQIKEAATRYRSASPRVHKDVMSLFRKRDIVKMFKYSEVEAGLKKVIEEHKAAVLDDTQISRVDSAAPSERGAPFPRAGQPFSTQEDQQVTREIEEDAEEIEAVRRRLR